MEIQLFFYLFVYSCAVIKHVLIIYLDRLKGQIFVNKPTENNLLDEYEKYRSYKVFLQSMLCHNYKTTFQY